MNKTFIKSPNTGFSLIELIIAIAIMGVLSSVIVPSFSKIQTHAKESAVKSLVYATQMAVESYFLEQGSYPSGDPITLTQLGKVLQENGEFKKLPTNPFTGKPYTESDPSGKIQYRFDSQINSYTITGYGKENKKVIKKVESL